MSTLAVKPKDPRQLEREPEVVAGVRAVLTGGVSTLLLQLESENVGS